MRMIGWAVRRVVFVGLAASTLCWGWFGLGWCERWTPHWINKSTREADQLLAKFEREDPQLAATLKKVREESKDAAFTATVRAANEQNGLSGLRALAESAKNGKKPAALRIAELAANPDLQTTVEQREAFLSTHGPAVEVLGSASLDAAAEYCDRLQKASRNQAEWVSVRDDPVALMVWDATTDESLRQYYVLQREWLGELIAEMCDGSKESIAKTIGVARKYDPLLRKAVVDLNLGNSAYPLFAAYGDAVNSAVRQYSAPLEQVLEVVYANRDYCDEANAKRPGRLASELAAVYSNREAVWKAARYTPLALRLHRSAPETAESLLKKYASDDVAAFLFTNYEKEIVPAASATDRFGDLALYVLNRYRDDARVHRMLGDPKIGPRVVPYLARFGDEGLDRVDANSEWLNKYFAANGDEISREWWTQIPGGAAADVARNWAIGRPCEWSELGWGALDVADAALLVASFGSSGVVTEGGKEAAKAVVKRTVSSEVRTAGAQATRGARVLAADAMRAYKATSLLRRAGEAGLVVAKTAGRVATLPASAALRVVRGARAGWTAVPPNVRIWVTRGLLGAGLFITLKERTVPALAQIGGEAIARIAGEPLANVGEKLRQTLGAVLGVDPSRIGTPFAIGVYVVCLALLILSTFIARPRRRALRYV